MRYPPRNGGRPDLFPQEGRINLMENGKRVGVDGIAPRHPREREFDVCWLDGCSTVQAAQVLQLFAIDAEIIDLVRAGGFGCRWLNKVGMIEEIEDFIVDGVAI